MEYNMDPYDIDAKKVTLEGVFLQTRNEKAKDLKERTIHTNYDLMFYKFFSTIKDKPFSELRPYHYQRIFDDLGKTHKENYLKRGKALLSSIYSYAIMNDLATVNYSQGITIRGQKSGAQDYFTEGELLKMMSLMGKVENADVIVLMCLTGLRPTELLNLSRFTVDLNKRIISGVGVKTNAGKQKRIPIVEPIYPFVELRWYNSKDFFFVDEDGNQMKYTYFRTHVYIPALEAMGIPYKSPKACRHTFANITHQKLDDRTRQEIIGHSNIKITNDIYTDIEDQKLVSSLDGAIKSLTKI